MPAWGFGGHYLLGTPPPYPVTLNKRTVTKNRNQAPIPAIAASMAEDVLADDPFCSIPLSCGVREKPTAGSPQRRPSAQGLFAAELSFHLLIFGTEHEMQWDPALHAGTYLKGQQKGALGGFNPIASHVFKEYLFKSNMNKTHAQPITSPYFCH